MIEEIGKEKFAYLAAVWIVWNLYAIIKFAIYWSYYVYCNRRYGSCHRKFIGLKMKYYLEKHTDTFQVFILYIDILVVASLLVVFFGNIILEHL